MKRSIFSILLLLLVAVTFIGFPNESSANKARGEIRDGNATGSSYNANDVEPSIKRAWERWNKNDRKKFTRGGKASSQTPSKGNRLVYDVYENKGWGISGNNFTFEGWSANIGYFHHDRYNQATYIGAVELAENGRETGKRKIFKTKMILNTNAATRGKGSNSDIYYDNGRSTRWCSTNKNKTKKEQNICNMEYKHVGFKAYLPLKELFPSTKENKQWKLYIIKNVNGHLVYDQLILPFNKGSKTWNKGTVTLKSGVSNKQGHRLIALGDKTQKRFEP